MPHPLADHHIRGLGPGRLRRLADAGITTVEALAAADPEAIAELQYFGQDVARMVIASAAEAVGEPPGVAAAPAPKPPPSNKKKAAEPAPAPGAGTKAAERVERSRDLAEQARAHAKGAKDDDQAKKTRRELKALVETLEQTVRQIRDDGVTKADYGQIKKQLGKLDDSLRNLLSRKPRAKWLRRARKAAKGARADIVDSTS